MTSETQAHSPFIKLAQFLKWQQITQTGGEAKILIQEGYVMVNGELELRRGRKLFNGDVVTVEERSFEVNL